MNNKILKDKYKSVSTIIPKSSYLKGVKELKNKHNEVALKRLDTIVGKLENFEIDSQYRNHVLSNGRYELHVMHDILLVYNYDTTTLYVDLILQNLTNHKDLNDSLNVSQEDDTKKSSGVKSNGIYSVLNNKWIKEPTQASIPDIDKKEFEKLFKEWEDKYFDLLEVIKMSEDKKKDIKETLNDLLLKYPNAYIPKYDKESGLPILPKDEYEDWDY